MFFVTRQYNALLQHSVICLCEDSVLDEGTILYYFTINQGHTFWTGSHAAGPVDRPTVNITSFTPLIAAWQVCHRMTQQTAVVWWKIASNVYSTADSCCCPADCLQLRPGRDTNVNATIYRNHTVSNNLLPINSNNDNKTTINNNCTASSQPISTALHGHNLKGAGELN